MPYRLLLTLMITPLLSGLISCTRTPETTSPISPSVSLEAQSKLSLTTLNSQRIRLVQELDALSDREIELQSLLLQIQPDDPGARQEVSQLGIELRKIQEEQEQLKQELDVTLLAQNRVTSQSTENVLQKSALTDIQNQILAKQTEIDDLIAQREQVRQQILSDTELVNRENIASLQVQTFSKDIQVKLNELETLSLELNALANTITSQGAESSRPDPVKLQAAASELRVSISNKETEIKELEQKIKALLRQVDLISVENRENFEKEKASLEAELTTERDELAKIEAQLRV